MTLKPEVLRLMKRWLQLPIGYSIVTLMPNLLEFGLDTASCITLVLGA